MTKGGERGWGESETCLLYLVVDLPILAGDMADAKAGRPDLFRAATRRGPAYLAKFLKGTVKAHTHTYCLDYACAQAWALRNAHRNGLFGFRMYVFRPGTTRVLPRRGLVSAA